MDKDSAKHFFRRHFIISGKSSEKKHLIRKGVKPSKKANNIHDESLGQSTSTAGEDHSKLSLKNPHNNRAPQRGNFIVIRDKFFGPDPEKNRSLKASKARVWRAVVAEFFATALFVFFATGGVVVALTFDPLGGALANLIVAFTQAFALQNAIYYAANISGGHINPAVTLSFLLVGRMRFIVAVLYWAAQIAGAIVGSALLRAVIVPDGNEGALGSTTLAPGYSAGRGILLEAILTFTLVSTVYATAIDKIGFGKSAPFAIGLTIFLDLIIGWKFTGASMNPARSLGPAIISGTWDRHWVYWVGPIIGALVAAALYDFVYISRPANKNPFSAGTRMETEGRPVTIIPAPDPLPAEAPVNDPSVNDTERTPKLATKDLGKEYSRAPSRVQSGDLAKDQTKIDVAPSPSGTPSSKRIMPPPM